jgi:hypothetical protein
MNEGFVFEDKLGDGDHDNDSGSLMDKLMNAVNMQH